MPTESSAESPKDFGNPPEGTVGRWLAEIKAYDKTFENWTTKAKRVVKRYRNESDAGTTSPLRDDPVKRFNILWSNVQTLQPAIYSRMPKPDIERAHKDRDPVARAAALILERAVRDQLEYGGFDSAMRSGRDDYLLVARGQARVRYVPTYGEEQRDKIFLQQDTKPQGEVVGDAAASPSYTMPDGSAIAGGAEVKTDPTDGAYIEQGDPYRPVVSECVKQDHVQWEDFGHTPAPKWDKVRAVWWREMMTRDQLIERFGKEKGEAVSLTKAVPNISEADKENYGDAFKRGEVFEIWDKTTGTVLWISSGYSDGPLDTIKDPLHLEGFFPCPEPFYATRTTDSLVPVTDYDEYRTQAEEIDKLTQRISLLTEALKIAGAYDGNTPALGKIFNSPENTLVAVDNWAAFAEKGGLPGSISFVPIKEVADTILALSNIRNALKQDIQEITGISDIVRGQSNPNETLGAQQIKQQFVGMRIKDRQDGMERFARDVVRITAEIIAQQFSKETLWDISGWQYTDEARQADKAMAAWETQQSPMLGHNGGPPLDMTATAGPMPSPPMPDNVTASAIPPDANGLMASASPSPPNMSSIPVSPAPSAILPAMMPQTERPLSSQEMFDKAVELLKSDRLRGYKITIETDSMILQDQQAEKQLGIEFVTSVSGFLEKAVPAAQAYPEVKGLLLVLLLFGVRQFKAGTTLESAFEALADQGAEQAAQPKQEAPDAETLKAQAQAKQAEAQLQIDQQRLVLETAKQRSDAADKDRAHQIEMQKLSIEERRLALDERKAATDEAQQAADADRVRQDTEAQAQQAARDFGLKVAAHNQAVIKTTNDNMVPDPANQSTPVDTIVGAVEQQAQKVEQMAAALTQQMAALLDQSKQLAQVMSAPTEIIRHPTTNAIVGARKVIGGQAAVFGALVAPN